jgi:hypothetical protein
MSATTTAAAPTPAGAQGSLARDARLTLRQVQIVPHGEEFLVGDPGAGEFILVPQIAVVIINALREGHTLGETAELAREHAGEDVEVDEFAQTLVELGFVAKVDGRSLADHRDRRWDGGRAGEWLTRTTWPLFSPAAWTVYTVLFIGCVVALISQPSLRPHGRDLLFIPHNPVDSVAIMFLVALVLTGLHECAHWLGARIYGVPASIGISRRWYFLVLQTDLTGIWALPKRRRLEPLLAGMALDTVRLAVLLAARSAAQAGLWHPPSLLAHFIAALIAFTFASLVFQFFVFLRTDLYAVTVTCLGCVNLTLVTQQVVKRFFRLLGETGRTALAEAERRDRQVARYYSWVYVAGMIVATWYFVTFFGPNIVTVARWTASNVASTSPTEPNFWQALILGSLALARVPLTVFVFGRERVRRAANARH